MGTTITLTCAMEEGCTAPVTHIDNKGYVYCAPHGEDRKSCRPCRKLTPAELKILRAGDALRRY